MMVSASGKKRREGRGPSFTNRPSGSGSELGRGAVVLLWIWVALKAALAEGGGDASEALEIPLLIAGMICLAGLLSIHDSEMGPAGDYFWNDYYPAYSAQLRRRTECRIVADRRHLGVPTYMATPIEQKLKRLIDGRGRALPTVRATRIIRWNAEMDVNRWRRGKIIA